MLLGFILGILFEKELENFKDELKKAVIKEMKKDKVRKVVKVENKRKLKKSK